MDGLGDKPDAARRGINSSKLNLRIKHTPEFDTSHPIE